MKTASHRSSTAVIGIILLLVMPFALVGCFAGSTEETELPEGADAAPTGTDDLSGETGPVQETTDESREKTGEKPGNSEHTDQEPQGAAPTPAPTPTPMFDIIDGQLIRLSITEEEFIEISEFLREELNVNDAALAGVLANIEGESGFNPNKVGDMGDAYGICQWHGPRLDQMVEYCKENGLNPVSLEGQLRFLAYDLKEVYILAYDSIRLCEDSEAGAVRAAYFFCAYYEVPANPEEESAAREELTKLLIYPKLNELSEMKFRQ